jgi:chromosome segregation ATPase
MSDDNDINFTPMELKRHTHILETELPGDINTIINQNDITSQIMEYSSTINKINNSIDDMKGVLSEKSKIKNDKDEDKKLKKFELLYKDIDTKYNNSYTQKQISEKKIEKIENDIEEIKDKYDAKETDIRDKAEKKIELKKRKIEEHEEAIKKLKEQIAILENDIEKIEEDTEDKIKVNDKARRKSIDKKLEEKEVSNNFIEVLDKRIEEYEKHKDKITKDMDSLSDNEKYCLLTSDIKKIQDWKRQLNDIINVFMNITNTCDNNMLKYDDLFKKYKREKGYKIYESMIKSNMSYAKVMITDIKKLVDKAKHILETVEKLLQK